MKRFKLVVAYDGTNYCGWQIQPNGITVEEVLNKTLSRFLKEEIHIIGASHSCQKTSELYHQSKYPVIFIQDIVTQEKHTNIISKMERFLCQQRGFILILSSFH